MAFVLGCRSFVSLISIIFITIGWVDISLSVLYLTARFEYLRFSDGCPSSTTNGRFAVGCLSSTFLVVRVIILLRTLFRLFEELAYRMRELRKSKGPQGGNGVKTEDKADGDEFAAKFNVVPAGT